MEDSLDAWAHGKDYYQMNGSTAADTRTIWCKYFNKTGGIGINVLAAKRVIIFDASWNPFHDVQTRQGFLIVSDQASVHIQVSCQGHNWRRRSSTCR